METEINTNKIAEKTTEQAEKNENSLRITSVSKDNLISTSRWANFIAIVGFVMLGIMVVISISSFILTPLMGEFQDFQSMPFPLYLFGLIYLTYAIIGFFPYYFLYTFARKVKKGLETGDQSIFDTGLINLRRLALFVGVLMIIALSMLLLIIPVMVFSFGMLQSLSGGTMF
ncbi:MAG: hypothetical protein H6Q19_1849 [Bacteroidetes bacterium]|nr:hypothetical protein [Bacteroidota bacterium]